ncbi:exopolysaccharide biosynthesis polyprenyl glycosylphosphotransferase [Altericroceibacterium xinjiangense]|uniref:exopolysaccharide biosynthesis polyprenyl glycosylphosphotransferase n=1 Tax=Altericroceibacterium xinjiangense TaxID=762261 RepID=UPI000F7F3572|nr:exopolysaccharide biosynthesis polyprenyl glycosylphosphotransferase [Altericroceibacterium xinjiangense]
MRHVFGLNEAAANVAGGLQRPTLAPVWLAFLAIALDLPTFATALWFAQYGSLAPPDFEPLDAAIRGFMTAAASIALLAFGDGYSLRSLRKPWQAAFWAFFALAGPVALAGVSLPHTEAFDFLLAAAVSVAAVVIPIRLVEAQVVAWIIDAGLAQRRAVVAGGGEHAVRLIRGLAARANSDVHICGIFDDRDDVRSPLQVLGVPKIGGYDELIEFVRQSEIDMVIISLPLEAEERINWLLNSFKVLPVEVRLSAFSQNYAFAPRSRDPLIPAIRGTFAAERRLVKRAFDVIGAAMALCVLWPVMVVAAIAIRLETRGPVFFRQKRHGYNDRIINVLKFRSMYVEAMDPTARRVVTRNDPRVTRVGRFLRRSSIDELPQLFNVLSGQLSLVGPRPHAVDALSSRQERFSTIVDGYSARHRLPPGITGWAQIHGLRGEIDVADKLHARFEHDLYYIENWSIWLDLMILLRTPLSLLQNRTAY